MTELWYTATQPLFFPELYMVERFARCHAVVVLREAQWKRRSFHTKTVVAGPDGERTLSMTVAAKGQRPMEELEVLPGWSEKVVRQLEATYRGAPDLEGKLGRVREVLLELDRPGLTVADVGEALIRWTVRVLGLSCEVVRSTDLVPDRPAEPTAWMASFAKQLGATDYLQGARAIEAYFEPGVFRQDGVRVWGQRWSGPLRFESLGLRPELSWLDAWFRTETLTVRAIVETRHGPGRRAGTAVRMRGFE